MTHSSIAFLMVFFVCLFCNWVFLVNGLLNLYIPQKFFVFLFALPCHFFLWLLFTRLLFLH